MVLLTAAFGAWFGAIMASYGGVVAERGWRKSANGRSVCVCGRELSALENIPVISWLALRGVARCCGTPIPARYVLCEATAAAIGAGLGAAAGWSGVVLGAGAGLFCALVTGRRP